MNNAKTEQDRTTWLEFARQHWPGISDDDAERILWECTAFPFADVETVKRQILESHSGSGGDVDLAISQSHAALDQAMSEQRVWNILSEE